MRNYHILLLVVVVSVLCHVTARRTHSALVLADAIDKIEKHYVDPVDHRELLESAMGGLTAKLDEHSQFIPPGALTQFEDFLAQEFAGIGILVEQPEPNTPVRVITPLVGSPALRAGLLPGDRIVGIDGQDVSNATLREVSDQLRGPIATQVSIEVLRDGEVHETVVVTREQIPLDSVVGDYRDDSSQWVFRVRNHPRIAILRCTSFGEKTVVEMAQVLRDLDNDFDALILDLRGNSGGLLNAAVEICDMFLNEGEIVSTRGRSVKDTTAVASEGTLVDPAIPMVVLIDGNSASASEIVAACLQDHGRAAVVGTRSYGKGTVQNVMMMEYGRSAFKLTTARYYRPSGLNIHRSKDAKEEDVWGVMPDPGLTVTLNEEQLQAVAQRWRRATYPVWEDREVTALTEQIEATDDVVTPLESPLELPQPSDDQPSDDQPSDDQPSDDQPSDDQPSDDQPSDDLDSLSPDDPLVDPQLRRALEYLQENIDGHSSPAEAA